MLAIQYYALTIVKWLSSYNTFLQNMLMCTCEVQFPYSNLYSIVWWERRGGEIVRVYWLRGYEQALLRSSSTGCPGGSLSAGQLIFYQVLNLNIITRRYFKSLRQLY